MRPLLVSVGLTVALVMLPVATRPATAATTHAGLADASLTWGRAGGEIHAFFTEVAPSPGVTQIGQDLNLELGKPFAFGVVQGNIAPGSFVAWDVNGKFFADDCASTGASAVSPQGGYTITSVDVPFVTTVFVVSVTAICTPSSVGPYTPPMTIRLAFVTDAALRIQPFNGTYMEQIG